MAGVSLVHVAAGATAALACAVRSGATWSGAGRAQAHTRTAANDGRAARTRGKVKLMSP